MEVFSKTALSAYVLFVIDNDVQILANRRQALRLYHKALAGAEGLSPDQVFEFPAEKADKIETYLTSAEAHRGDSVTVYAFVRLMGELRRALRTRGAFSQLPTPATTAPPSEQEEPAPE